MISAMILTSVGLFVISPTLRKESLDFGKNLWDRTENAIDAFIKDPGKEEEDES